MEYEAKCEAVKQKWLKDFEDIFKEDLSQEDRIDMEPVKATLIPNHEEIELPHPKVANEVPAYLQPAAEKEIKRMLDGGLLEEVTGYSQNVSRGFFVTKHTKEGEEVKVRLVADYRGVNKKLQRPGQPLENAFGNLKKT